METSIKIKRTVRTTPHWQRTTLLFLLFISAISGYAVNAYLFFHLGTDTQSQFKNKFSPSAIQKSFTDFSLLNSTLPDQTNHPGGTQFERVLDLLKKSTDDVNKDVVSITFNGSMTYKNGTVAMINKEAMSVGSDIQGIKVIAITDQTLTLEYEGETQELIVGQTVSVELH